MDSLSTSQRLTPRQLADRIARGEDLQLVDVREPAEWAIGHLPESVLIPRGELSSRAQELDPDRPVVCICHHGIRSQAAAAFLSQRGFETVFDLVGGLDRWSLEIDPGFPRYGP